MTGSPARATSAGSQSSRTDRLYLALDQGGHSTRAMVFDEAGELAAAASANVRANVAAGGLVEQDPDEIVASIFSVLEHLGHQLRGDLDRIVSAGLATQRSSMVAWNTATGQPLTRILSWQDRRTAAWVEALAGKASFVRERTGLRLSPHYGASKMRWCLDHCFGAQHALARHELALAPLASYLIASCSRAERVVIDPANASRTLLWNPATLDWDPELLALFGVPLETLPRVQSTIADFGSLSIPGSARPIALRAVSGDQSAAFFGEGDRDDSSILINIGTGAFLQRATPPMRGVHDRLLHSVVLQEGEPSASGRLLRVIEGTVHGAGAALTALAEAEKLGDIDARLPAWLAESDDPGIYINGVSGVGSPYWRPELESRFARGGHTAAERAVAVVESIAFLIARNVEEMATPAAELRRLDVTGGLARLDGLCQRIASLTQLECYRPPDIESTARGIAWLLSARTGWRRDSQSHRFEPQTDPALRARYAEWREAMKALTGIG